MSFFLYFVKNREISKKHSRNTRKCVTFTHVKGSGNFGNCVTFTHVSFTHTTVRKTISIESIEFYCKYNIVSETAAIH